MGETAENVAERFGITRQEQDVFACRSQQKAAAAQSGGRFDREIAPLEIPQKRGDAKVVDKDEFIRPTTTIEGLAKLKPAFRAGGSVTAGNSSGINDGAAALLIASADAVRKYNLSPLARVVTSAVAGVEPRVMGLGPVPSTRKALAQAGIDLAEVGVIELNEAFAAQVLGCLRELGLPADEPRLNPNGGAIALGHPLGMSGARLLLTAAHELRASGGRYALATMCVGVGQGMATVLEKV
jgi:acetyl-CoA acyltransferase